MEKLEELAKEFDEKKYPVFKRKKGDFILVFSIYHLSCTTLHNICYTQDNADQNLYFKSNIFTKNWSPLITNIELETTEENIVNDYQYIETDHQIVEFIEECTILEFREKYFEENMKHKRDSERFYIIKNGKAV
jgi:hypothetical protein